MARLSISRFDRGHGKPRTNLGVVDAPNPIDPVAQAIFHDPRASRDRRKKGKSSDIPVMGCRRKGSRRTTVYIKNEDWWMKRKYNNLE